MAWVPVAQGLMGFISHPILYTMFRREYLKTVGALIATTKTSSVIHSLPTATLTRKMSCVTIPGLDVHRIDGGRGQIQVIFGPMFSGKTTELLRRLKRYQVANHSCLLIKYDKDVRYDQEEMASTHDQQKSQATPASRLYSVKYKAMDHSIIAVDEGQFFPDVVEFSEEMANLGKTVIIAALDGTFQRKEFGDILKLVPLAESVIKLNAVCMNCYKDAAFTKRLGSEKKIEVIGGADKYMAVCRECFSLSSVQELLIGAPLRSSWNHSH